MSSLRKLGSEHTVDVDLIPESPVVLDVGARDFEFDVELLKLRPKAKIYAVEADPKVADPQIVGITYMNCAITHRHDAEVEWQGPGEGGFICGIPGDPGYGWGVTDVSNFSVVKNITIKQLMRQFMIPHFDLVKLDCEGSEFGILENWPGPVATQISVEFHDFVDRNRWNDSYFENLFTGRLHNYAVKLFKLTGMGPGNSQGHWDTVLVLKDVA